MLKRLPPPETPLHSPMLPPNVALEITASVNTKKRIVRSVDGLWMAYFSTFEINPNNHQWETLKYPQDFLISWFDFKSSEVAKMNTDTVITLLCFAALTTIPKKQNIPGGKDTKDF